MEERVRNGLEVDGDFGEPDGHALAGSEVERDALPARVVDEGLERDEGLGDGVRRDAWLLAVGARGLPPAFAGGVLCAHHLLGDASAGHGLQGAEEFDLFAAHGVGIEGDGRFHGHQAQEVHHVVLEDVAERPRTVVVFSATLHADGFAHGNLDVVDEPAVPEGLEDAVGEPEDEKVLDGFLAEVMVDSIYAVFGEGALECAVEFAGACKIAPERFLDDDPRPGRVAVECERESRFAESADDFAESRRRRGQVEETPAAGSAPDGDFIELFLQEPEASGVVGPGEITEPGRESRPSGLIERTGPHKLPRGLAHVRAEALVAPGGPSVSET